MSVFVFSEPTADLQSHRVLGDSARHSFTEATGIHLLYVGYSFPYSPRCPRHPLHLWLSSKSIIGELVMNIVSCLITRSSPRNFGRQATAARAASMNPYLGVTQHPPHWRGSPT
eukprot:5578883-Pyramimonas_sp.AAC.1